MGVELEAGLRFEGDVLETFTSGRTTYPDFRQIRGIGRALIWALALWVVLITVVWLVQRKMIYLPSRDAPPPARDYFAGGEDIVIPTEDGLELRAWWAPGVEPRSGATVVVFHGNASDREKRAPLASALAALGHDVLLHDYRGYAGNPGSPTEAGFAADARAVADWLAARNGVDPGAVVYYGESLGCGVAIRLATERPAAGLVLRSPFTSLTDAARHHFPILPVGLLLKDRFPSLDRIPDLRVPVLFVVGTDDTVVPPEQSRTLFEAAREPKRWFELEGADHNDYDLLAGEEIVAAVDAFLREEILASEE